MLYNKRDILTRKVLYIKKKMQILYKKVIKFKTPILRNTIIY